MNTAPPGWYPDPSQGGRIRYWNGAMWSDAQPATAAPTTGAAPAPQPTTPAYPQQSAQPTAPPSYAPAYATSTQVPTKTSGLAIASIVCSTAGTMVAGVGFIAGIILGHMALSEIAKSGGRIEGRGLAMAGLIIGYVLAALIVIAIVVVIALLANSPEIFDDISV